MSSPNDLVPQIFGAAGCSRLRAQKHFLSGSSYGRRPNSIPNPNPDPDPDPNPDQKRARNAAAPLFDNVLLFRPDGLHIAFGR